MKLSVIVPVLNEKATLETVVQTLLSVDIPCEKEIIIVDDHSTDGSTEIIKNLKNKNPGIIKTIHKSATMGKGNAIKDAVPEITGGIVIIQDADMEYDINEYGKLLAPIMKGEADVVFGSRFLGSIKNMRPEHMFANRILTLLANLLYGLKITDEATGYKVIKADVFRKFNMQAQKFEFCPELVAKSARMKCRIKEVPITYSARTVKEGKKIKWHDAFSAVWTLIKYRFISF
jgi:glycosyltransferase involved in cell wall biosynthesis